MASKPPRFRPSARADLEGIWREGVAHWSPDTADAYIRALLARIDLIAAHPEIARERHEFTPPVRIHPAGAHVVVYRIAEDHIDIIRIRHGREDWARGP